MSTGLVLILIGAASAAMDSTCPAMGAMPEWHPRVNGLTRPTPHPDYADALAALDLDAVIADLKSLTLTSQPFWPADYGSYVGLLVRLAWHCAGTYRSSDGLGGCDGGRQRFLPEAAWADNTNLDKARRLLDPIKRKYGLGLSWGDLIVLAADVAMEQAGFKTLGTCLGRIDEPSGFWSHELGPSAEQRAVAPCADAATAAAAAAAATDADPAAAAAAVADGIDGDCEAPFGSTTVGLIYVNPQGPRGDFTDLKGAAAQIRSTFRRMGMNDTETVALIGGGHAFGKAHGACPKGPGPSPAEAPLQPWPGLCGSGKGDHAFTSGFEGPWTETPDQWSNKYFEYLRDLEFEPFHGQGGGTYYRISGDPEARQAPMAHDPNKLQPVMMLATDVSLTKDRTYEPIVMEFANDKGSLEHAFRHAWYKLMTRDMGPHQRCRGPLTPPPQPWQHDVDMPKTLPTHAQIEKTKAVIRSRLFGSENPLAFVTLAAQCAATHRVTDYRGGCNGARIRFSPEREFPQNWDLKQPLAELTTATAGMLTTADAIVLAGTLAVEQLADIRLPFCPGRGDAVDGSGSVGLDTYLTRAYTDGPAEVHKFMHSIKISGLTIPEAVAFMARDSLSPGYFRDILTLTWTPTGIGGKFEFRADEKFASQADMFLLHVPELRAVAERFADGPDHEWAAVFAQAWIKLMNADLFAGPAAVNCKQMFSPDQKCEKTNVREYCELTKQCTCPLNGNSNNRVQEGVIAVITLILATSILTASVLALLYLKYGHAELLARLQLWYATAPKQLVDDKTDARPAGLEVAATAAPAAGPSSTASYARRPPPPPPPPPPPRPQTFPPTNERMRGPPIPLPRRDSNATDVSTSPYHVPSPPAPMKERRSSGPLASRSLSAGSGGAASPGATSERRSSGGKAVPTTVAAELSPPFAPAAAEEKRVPKDAGGDEEQVEAV